MSNRTVGCKVTYITRGEPVTLRMQTNALRSICEAARDLRATHFITREGDEWGLFEMRTAQRNNPIPGEWSINDPIKLFPLDALDGAVMYAITLRSRS